MRFSKTDFESEGIAIKLNAVVMDQLDLSPMLPFKKLGSLSKKNLYNKYLHVYIDALPDEWSEKLTRDFNAVIYNYMSCDEFKAELQTTAQVNTIPRFLDNDELFTKE